MLRIEPDLNLNIWPFLNQRGFCTEIKTFPSLFLVKREFRVSPS